MTDHFSMCLTFRIWWADGGFNRSEQHLELEVCTWEDPKVGQQRSLGGLRSAFPVTRVCDASIVRPFGLQSRVV
jgi:hypothetical protein